MLGGILCLCVFVCMWVIAKAGGWMIIITRQFSAGKSREWAVRFAPWQKNYKSYKRVKSHIENLDFYLHFKVWMVCLGQSMPEMSTFEKQRFIFFPSAPFIVNGKWGLPMQWYYNAMIWYRDITMQCYNVFFSPPTINSQRLHLWSLLQRKTKLGKDEVNGYQQSWTRGLYQGQK